MSWPAVAACLGGVLVTFDAMLINAVFPAAVAALGRDVALGSWLINATNLALATGLLIGGRLADAFGRRRMYVAGTAGFGIASALCAIAPGFWTLLLLRSALGCASALLMVCSLALLADVVPRAQRAAAVGLYGALSGLGSVLGPLAGAWVTGRGHWQLGFLFSAAACAVTLWLTRRFVPRDAPRAGPARVDWATGAVAGVALALAVLGFSRVSQPGAGPGTALCAAGALAAAALAALRELRSADPLFPRALRTAGYAHALLGILALAVVFGAVLFAVPLFVTRVQGAAPAAGGLALLPACVLSIAGALLGGRLAARRPYTVPGSLGLALALLSAAAMSSWERDTAAAVVWLWSGVGGLGLGLGIPAMAGYALQQAGEQHSGAGSAWYQTLRQLGIVAGVALFASSAQDQGELRGCFLRVVLLCSPLALLWWIGIPVIARRRSAHGMPPGSHQPEPAAAGTAGRAAAPRARTRP